MEEIIEPISKELLKAELTEEKRLRMTNKSHNQIYIITAQDSPNIMKLLFNKIPTIQLINRVLHIIALKSNICKTITFKSAGKYYLSQQSVTKTKR